MVAPWERLPLWIGKNLDVDGRACVNTASSLVASRQEYLNHKNIEKRKLLEFYLIKLLARIWLQSTTILENFILSFSPQYMYR